MNLDSLSFALSQISYSVANLTKKNYKNSVNEISHLVSQHGAAADRHLFRCLFSHIDFSGDGKNSGKDFHQIQYLTQESASLLTKSNFVSTLCYAIDNPLHHQKTLKPYPALFSQLSKILKLTRIQEVTFGLALLQSSHPDTRNFAAQFVRQKLPNLLSSYVDTESSAEGGLQDVAVEVLHLLLSCLQQDKDHFGISTEQRESFLTALKKDFPKERVPVVLAPLLYSEAEDSPAAKLTTETLMLPKSIMEGNLAEMIKEIGYGCTASLEECRNTLVQFGVREITAGAIARVLGMMANSITGLPGEQIPVQVAVKGTVRNLMYEETKWETLTRRRESLNAPGNWNETRADSSNVQNWNVDNFIQVVQQLAPHISFREVVSSLDYPEFAIKSRQGLQIIVQALSRGLQEIFPIEYIYRPWKNTEGQLSWITQALTHPDIFCFADYPYHSVVIDVLKSPPDEENREIVTWKSLALVDVLLWLSESHYQQVSELFKFPMTHCPDMLVLALLQSTQSLNTLKHELLSRLIPIFLGNHPNSAIILHYAWHCQGQSSTVRTLLMHSMAEWYMHGEPHDQSRLSRILDVAQDLKALSMLLNATPFAFVIDLACLASRREYLKLDKWLSDKIREHGEAFVQAAVKFLQRRCPQLMGGNMKDEMPQSKSQQLPPETITCMLACLQACAQNCSQEISEPIVTMVTNATQMLAKQRQAPPGVIGAKAPGMNQGMPGPSMGVNNPVNPMDPLGGPPLTGPSLSGQSLAGPSLGPSLGHLGLASGSSAVGSPFPSALTSLSSTPGSPAKVFPPIAPATQPTPAFNPMQSIQGLTSQLQGLNMQNSLGGGSTAPVGRTPSLGALSAQAIRQQQTQADRIRQHGQAQSSGDVSSFFPAVSQQFSKEIEDEANTYFQRIYNHSPHPSVTIDEVLEMLKRFKDSPVKKEKEVFACMLRNLFEEYRFFPQYPDKELHTTAVLFGGIIEQGLVTYMELGLALRYVLEALKKPHGTKMYYFGIAALDRFKTRLKDYPQYCQHLGSIPHFSQFQSHLIEYVEYGARSQEPPNRPQGPVTSIPPTVTTSTPPTSSTASTPATTSAVATAAATTTTASSGTAGTPLHSKVSIANATNIDTLLAGNESSKEEIAVPPEAVQDKVFFIFNNLSLANLSQKSEELREHVSDEFMPWVAQYLVMKRASIEPNFHTLYANFNDTLQVKDFGAMVIRETFRNIKVLLRSDKGIANFSDRSLLKNLGHWLGLLTLAKNKPILHIDIDLKSLLYEAYHKGAQELLYVVPFVAKVLESCAKSKVFKPPNPWTMGIMNALAELHQEQDLKLNLKFEIEVLCKTLSIDINDLHAGNYLKNTDRLHTLEIQLSGAKPSKAGPEPSLPPSVAEAAIPTPPVAATTTVTTTTATTGTTSTVQSPPMPKFNYNDLNVLSLAGLAQHITMNDELALFQENPQLKQFVRMAIERSVQELLPPVVERSVKIALTTCEQIVKKDFALDPEEGRMRGAAHHMVRNMTAGMALITCREPLLISINNNLKKAFLAALMGATQAQKDQIEQASQVLAQENTELACVFIQKTAVEKALPEMDKRLATEFEMRKHARNDNRRYCDPVVLTYQAERMPEQIRLKVGGVTPMQMSVYEEFARNIPGFKPTAPETTAASLQAKTLSSFGTDEISAIFDNIARDMEQQMRPVMTNPSPLVAALHTLLEAVYIARQSREVVTALALLQKAVEGLLEGMAMPAEPDVMTRFRDCHLLVLKGLQDQRAYGPQWTNRQVTRCLIECRQEYRYNLDAVEVLIRSHLVTMPQYDLHLAQSMENGVNFMAVTFSMGLIQRLCVDDKQPGSLNLTDLSHVIENLTRIATHSRQLPEGLANLLENIRARNDEGLLYRAPGGAVSMIHSGMSDAGQYDDPPGLHEKTEFLLREWVQMFHSPAAGRDSAKAFAAFVGQMHQQGILKTDDLITRFFRLCTEMCVDLCYRALAEQSQSPTLVRAKCFHTLDAFVRLIALLVKHSGDANNSITKINLLNKVLGIVAGVLLQDHEVRYTEFQQLPYHRIFIMLFIELNAPEHVLEGINFQVLTAFCNTFHLLRPAKAPGFAYAWLELISHRVFIGRMLALTPQQRVSPPKGWSMYAQLLIDLFKFLTPFLRNAELQKPTQLLYKGTMRVLLVLLHDFPEFLCDYHYAFCDVIPPNCIQMRNLILSAFPHNMRLPDPFTPNLKVDRLTEISHAPRVMTNFVNMIQPETFKKDLESYLRTRAPVTFLSELRSSLQMTAEPGMRYNIQLLNALVLYVGTQAITYIHNKGHTPSMSTIAHSSHMDIFQNLAVDLDTEGRYLFLNAIANQLRYPNSHTHYFSCTLLYLFAEANSEAIQEQITRVLLERLIVNRPHPWGLLVTFIELIKNPQFKFWNHEFVHCAPEIEKLFESVARSCVQHQQAQQRREGENQQELNQR